MAFVALMKNLLILSHTNDRISRYKILSAWLLLKRTYGLTFFDGKRVQGCEQIE